MHRLLDDRCVSVPALMRASDTPGGAGHANSPSLAATTNLVHMSADGRYVAFLSTSQDYDPEHRDVFADVFRRDLLTDEIVHVSQAQGGENPNEGVVFPTISADGRYVAFASGATNLVVGDVNGSIDVFVKDLETGLVELASVGDDQRQGSSSHDRPFLAPGGRHVVFDTESIEVGSDGHLDVIIRTLGAASGSETISLSTQGQHATSRQGQNAFRCVPSADGSRVVFYSLGRGLVREPDPPLPETGAFVYLRDRTAAETTMVSLDNLGAPRLGNYASISADGAVIAWRSEAHTAPGNEGDGSHDVFARRVDGVGGTTLISATPASLESSGDVGLVSLSADGRYVAFLAAGDDLLPGDHNGTWDAFVYDREEEVLTRVSVDEQGVGGEHPTWGVSMSGDGATVALLTQSNLMPGDDNRQPVVYVRRFR